MRKTGLYWVRISIFNFKGGYPGGWTVAYWDETDLREPCWNSVIGFCEGYWSDSDFDEIDERRIPDHVLVA